MSETSSRLVSSFVHPLRLKYPVTIDEAHSSLSHAGGAQLVDGLPSALVFGDEAEGSSPRMPFAAALMQVRVCRGRFSATGDLGYREVRGADR